jgi:flagellar protein FliO/FliZ
MSRTSLKIAAAAQARMPLLVRTCAAGREFLGGLGRRPSIAGRLGGRGRIIAALCFGALVGPAIAQVESSRPFAAPSTVTSAAPSGVASLGQVTLALALVLAVIFIAAWLLRRVRGFGRPASGALDILADLPVGQKERAVLIRVGTTQVLLGVAPGRVTTLHVLAEPVSITPPTAGSDGPGSSNRPDFKSLLMKSLGK